MWVHRFADEHVRDTGVRGGSKLGPCSGGYPADVIGWRAVLCACTGRDTREERAHCPDVCCHERDTRLKECAERERER
eukprot:424087-Prymnesium_polylepis.1